MLMQSGTNTNAPTTLVQTHTHRDTSHTQMHQLIHLYRNTVHTTEQLHTPHTQIHQLVCVNPYHWLLELIPLTTRTHSTDCFNLFHILLEPIALAIRTHSTDWETKQQHWFPPARVTSVQLTITPCLWRERERGSGAFLLSSQYDCPREREWVGLVYLCLNMYVCVFDWG